MTIGLLLMSLFTFVELNCENLFDCQHDTLKQDTEFLPDGSYHWTRSRYWRKLDHIGQTILACGEQESGWQLPDMAVLCEVENDTVMRDLTRRSLLRKARYKYVMTASPDVRGIDIALVYSPFSFYLLRHHSVRIPTAPGMRPTRDLLYASGLIAGGDTLHVIAVHWPSKRGGARQTDAFRRKAAETVTGVIDSIKHINPNANIVVAGDFNDYSQSENINLLVRHGLQDVSDGATGSHGAHGTYRYKGQWGSLDHILVSAGLVSRLAGCYVMDAPFLLEEDPKYGGVKPRRNYLGPRYLNGFSDHLPLVARFCFGPPQ